jgi:hypothetical protein
MMENYEIHIKGHLDGNRAEWFERMTITLIPDGITVLSGFVEDQAELYAVIRKIRDLGLPLIYLKQKSYQPCAK